MNYYDRVPRASNPRRAPSIKPIVTDPLPLAAAGLLAACLAAAPALATSQEGQAHAEINITTATTTPALTPPARTAARAIDAGSIAIDGKGDDPGWRQVPFADTFVQQEPEENRPPTERTRIKAAYDQAAIYFLFDATDSLPNQIHAQLTRRDQNSASDWVHVWLDTNDDHKNAYRFSVNPRGVKQDARIFDDSVEDLNWDAVWEAATQTSTQGWSAELRIPFSQLRYDETHPRWGFQARRDIRRRNELAYLSPVPRGSGRTVSHFGILEGLERLPEARGITVVPYARAGYTNDQGDGSADATLGAEARFGLGASLSLDLSVNPDFGQVEADPSVLNLGATEIYFAEKRPFFLEGKEILNFGLGFGDGPSSQHTLFYSRRIGVEPILGAVKLTGKTTDGWAIGLLDAVTDSGENSPLANAAVARFSKDFRQGKTTLGVIGTHRVTKLDPETRPEFLRNAGSGGIDLRHRVDDYELIAKFFGSLIEGSPEALTTIQESSVHYFQRPDAPHLDVNPNRRNMLGWGTNVVLGKLSGPHWRGAVGSQIFSPGFDPNSLGYLPSADRQTAWFWFNLRSDEPNDFYRRYAVNFNGWYEQTFGGERYGLGGNVNANVMLSNYWYLFAGIGPGAEALDITALRGGPALLKPPFWEVWAGFTNDDRSWIFAEVGGWAGGRTEDAASWGGVYIFSKLRPTSSLEITLHPNLEYRVDDAQYVDTTSTPQGGYIVGHLDQIIFNLAARADWTLNPDLSIQLYVAPYFTAGKYTGFKRVIAPQASAWRDRFGPTDYSGSDVFLFRELRSNLVVRWEYALGSTLFLVWAHGQTLDTEERGTLSPARDVADIIASPSTDTILVKMAYWFAI